MKNKLFVLSVMLVVVVFAGHMTLQGQTNEVQSTVNVNIQPCLTLLIDGSDAGDSLYDGDYTAAEAINFGELKDKNERGRMNLR